MNNRYLMHSELALVAYSNLYPDMSQSEYPASLQYSGRGLSPLQADLFASTYRVVDHHSDSTGLSATVFEEIGNSSTNDTLLVRRQTRS